MPRGTISYTGVQEQVQHSCTHKGLQWLSAEQYPTSMIHVPCQEHPHLKLLTHQQSPLHITDAALSRPLLPIKHKHAPVQHPIQATTQPKLTALSDKYYQAIPPSPVPNSPSALFTSPTILTRKPTRKYMNGVSREQTVTVAIKPSHFFHHIPSTPFPTLK